MTALHHVGHHMNIVKYDVSNKDAPSSSINKSEVKYAINQLNNSKATGSNKIYAKVLKMVAEDDTGLHLLTSIFNDIYNKRRIPLE